MNQKNLLEEPIDYSLRCSFNFWLKVLRYSYLMDFMISIIY